MKLFYEDMTGFPDLAEYIRNHSTLELVEEVGMAMAYWSNGKYRQEFVKAKEKSELPSFDKELLKKTHCYAFASPFEATATVYSFLSHFKINVGKFEESYGLMDDDLSRETFFYTLLFRLMPNNIGWLEKVRCHGKEYYRPELLPQEVGGVLLDCGAYDGLTAREFEEVYGEHKRIYSFEPVPSNFALLEKNTEHIPNMVCLNKGVGAKEETLRFLNGKDGSRAYATGNIEVPIVTIDSEITEPVTFVKMDIEGLELPAMKGAEGRLVADRPYMAICIYHLISDYHKIILYIRDLLPDYVFNIRHHGDLDWAAPQYGTVLYACPKEKWNP